jgi:hypothetical protein
MSQLARVPRPTEAFHLSQVQFVGEQDGEPERQLKESLAASLRPLGVRKAYLAVVSYDQRKGPQRVNGDDASASPLSVALCLTLSDEAAARHNIVERAGADFAARFGPTQRMDIIFLTDQQELALQKVCKPFYMAMEPIE